MERERVTFTVRLGTWLWVIACCLAFWVALAELVRWTVAG